MSSSDDFLNEILSFELDYFKFKYKNSVINHDFIKEYCKNILIVKKEFDKIYNDNKESIYYTMFCDKEYCEFYKFNDENTIIQYWIYQYITKNI